MLQPTIEQRISALRQGQPNPFLCGSGTAAQQAPRLRPMTDQERRTMQAQQAPIRNGLFSDQQTQQQAPVNRPRACHFTRWGEKKVCPDGFHEVVPGYYESNLRKTVESRVVKPRMLNA